MLGGRHALALACAVIAALLGACGNIDDEIEAESAAILARVPVGTPYGELAAAMRDLGFSCVEGRRQFSDRTGAMRDAAPHLSCTREQSHWLVCTRRTRAILLQLNGKLSNILVNVGRFCS
jgi:hypothetical protein